jgi:hypothetical protein
MNRVLVAFAVVASLVSGCASVPLRGIAQDGVTLHEERSVRLLMPQPGEYRAGKIGAFAR